MLTDMYVIIRHVMSVSDAVAHASPDLDVFYTYVMEAKHTSVI